MPKVLIIAACLINLGDDRGGITHAEGEIADVPKDVAFSLTNNERALYCDKKDDHSKDGRNTASDKMLAAAAAMAKARSARKDEKPAA
jgi:hypothetical protein